MSLLQPIDPAHAPALKRFEYRLDAGGQDDRAVLLNLKEEDRVPDSKRAAFQTKLCTSKRRAWKDRFAEAAPVASCALPVATRPTATWWHHVTLAQLQRFNYVSLAMKGSRPPRRLRLTRPMGRPVAGADRTFWITDATHARADDLRDRLGLCWIQRGAELYRIRILVDATPARPLFVPSALDAGFYPAWRRPSPAHPSGWGMTRHLATDAAGQPELLAFPDAADDLAAHHVGPVKTDPPNGYLRARGIP